MTEQTWPVSQCSAPECQAPIVWARTEQGKNTPVDAQPSPAGVWLLERNVRLDQPAATYVAKAERAAHDGPLHTTHWATCAKPNRYRR